MLHHLKSLECISFRSPAPGPWTLYACIIQKLSYNFSPGVEGPEARGWRPSGWGPEVSLGGRGGCDYHSYTNSLLMFCSQDVCN